MLMMTWYHSQCYVLSGPNFEATGDSVVHYYLSNCLLRGHMGGTVMTKIMLLVSYAHNAGLEGIHLPIIAQLPVITGGLGTRLSY